MEFVIVSQVDRALSPKTLLSQRGKTMYRTSIRVTAFFGVLFCLISGVSFLVNEIPTSPLYGVALLTCVPAGLCSFVSAYLSLRRVRYLTPSIRSHPSGRVSIQQLVESDLRARQIRGEPLSKRAALWMIVKPIIWLLTPFLVYTVYFFVMSAVMQSYIGSIHFGAFVVAILAPIAVIPLLYVVNQLKG